MEVCRYSKKARMELVQELIQESAMALTRMNRELTVMVVLQECLERAAVVGETDSKVEDGGVVNSAVATTMAEVAASMAEVAASMAEVAASLEEMNLMKLAKVTEVTAKVKSESVAEVEMAQ